MAWSFTPQSFIQIGLTIAELHKRQKIWQPCKKNQTYHLLCHCMVTHHPKFIFSHFLNVSQKAPIRNQFCTKMRKLWIAILFCSTSICQNIKIINIDFYLDAISKASSYVNILAQRNLFPSNIGFKMFHLLPSLLTRTDKTAGAEISKYEHKK